MKPTNGTAAAPSTLRIEVGQRLTDYATILKRLDVVLAELEPDGLVAMDVRDKFERLVVSERVRVANLARSLGVSPVLPRFTGPSPTQKTAENPVAPNGTQKRAENPRL